MERALQGVQGRVCAPGSESSGDGSPVGQEVRNGVCPCALEVKVVMVGIKRDICAVSSTQLMSQVK